jgi:hypothetical protein
VLAQLLEPPYTDPYVRWCGRGGAARLPPIPIFGTFRTSQHVRRMSAVEGITDVLVDPRGNVTVFAQFISAHYLILIS